MQMLITSHSERFSYNYYLFEKHDSFVEIMQNIIFVPAYITLFEL